MNMALEMSVGTGLLYVKASGRFSLAEAKRTFLEMLESVARNHVRKVLLDGLALKGNPKLMERFFYSEFAAQALATSLVPGVPRSTQFAYVLIIPMLDPERFGENVAVNRGMFVRVFDNVADALQWLEATPSNSPIAPTANCDACSLKYAARTT